MDSLVKNAFEQLQVAIAAEEGNRSSSKEEKKKKKKIDKSGSKSSLLEDSTASLSLEDSFVLDPSATPDSTKKKKKKSSSSSPEDSSSSLPPLSPKKKKSSSSSSTKVGASTLLTVVSALQTLRNYSDVAVCPESNSFGTQLLTTLRKGLPGKDGIALIVTALRGASGDVAAVSQATAALANLVTDPKSHAHLLVEVKGIDLLFSLLHQYPHVSSIVHDILRVLTVAAESNEDEHKVAILTARPEKNGAILTILQAMKAQLGVSISVQTQACALLHALTAVDKGREKIVEGGGLASIYAALKKYQDDKGAAELRRHARATFRHLLPEPAADALEQMQDNKQWKMEQHVVTLRKFAAEEQNKIILGQAGSIDAVVDAMKHNQGDASVQEQACGTLLSLSSAKNADKNHPDFDADNNNKKMIAEASGIDAVVTALQTHRTVMDVQAYGCRTLWSLATLDDNKAIIGKQETGAIPAILQAIREHEKVAIVSENALPALAELAADADCRKAIVAADKSIDTILLAMKNHATNAQVQQFSCHAFSNMAVSDNGKLTIAKAGGISAILNTMKSHIDQPAVQIYACSALGNLAMNEESKEAIATEGGIAAILQAMQAYDTHPAVLDKACGALRNLSTNSHIKALIKKAGGATAVTDALQKHPQLDAVASSVLKNLNS